MMMSNYEVEQLRAKLNKKYDEVEQLDKQIDYLILRRNHLFNEIESGVAMLAKYSTVGVDDDEDSVSKARFKTVVDFFKGRRKPL